MDDYALRTLQILDAVGNDPDSSQRQLAKKLDVSLGLVNAFIKRLVQKGYFKARTIPRNRVKYILTPKGAAEKTRLTYEYIQHSYRFYKAARQRFRSVFQKLMQDGVQRIVFYGAGDVAEIAFVCLQETPIKLAAVVDNARVGERFLSRVVKDPDVLRSFAFDKILVTTVEPQTKILKDIQERGVCRDRVILLK